MKSFVRWTLVFALCTPTFASAQTTADIAAQAQALLTQVMLLQQQLGVTTATSVQSSMTTTKSITACPQVGFTLRPGMSGPEVTRLQQFLALDRAIYPEGLVTGYYGALTQAAVGRWQAKYNIVYSGTPSTTGYGLFGPKTAAAVALQCTKMISSGTTIGPTGTSDPIVGGFIKVSPLTGQAPLSVSVDVTVNTVRSCVAATYTLSWGDSTPSQTIVVPANQCEVLEQMYTHMYLAAGSYTIRLASGLHETTSTVTVTGVQTTTTTSTGGTSTGGSTNTGGSQTSDGTDSNNTGTAGTTVASGDKAIQMTANAYSPKTLTIASGTKVTWTNSDSMIHTVSADNGSYNGGSMQPGQTYSLTFTIPGEYTYFCAFHGGPNGVGMSGKIVVQ